MKQGDHQPRGRETDAYAEGRTFAERHPEFEREIDDSVIPSESVLEESVGQRGFFNERDREAAEAAGRLEEESGYMEGHTESVNDLTPNRETDHYGRATGHGEDVIGIEDGSVNSRGVGRRPDEGSVSIGADNREQKNEELNRSSDHAVSEGRLPGEMAGEEAPFSGVRSEAADPNLGPEPFGDPAVEEIDRSPARDHIDDRHRERFM
ncbi:hypothetical protein [Edaphobacillus lindanitolerans]|uniref:Uncharacterized protein n=1 Tax=Edaphobacillus lindanitolerans TaxID=550447 RepID=A0A1U7PLN5_9BACI|nr:hypothetical protein [Edaphobacillus lindanitolerans]SIT69239.1 hypothetical protein SAMN05428946_0464 [Edaphobacillus lindanitolerans]